jgi:hypothetical protein
MILQVCIIRRMVVGGGVSSRSLIVLSIKFSLEYRIDSRHLHVRTLCSFIELYYATERDRDRNPLTIIAHRRTISDRDVRNVASTHRCGSGPFRVTKMVMMIRTFVLA